jgi:ubiquinone/menaquinone biosynthesis C-methylase UbiE
MADTQIKFNDGAAYEKMMGVWSRIAGAIFLDWLAPATEKQWVDIGCGNGAFTELIMQRCAPAQMKGIDPSEGQLAFARTRGGARGAEFVQGDAMALPLPDKSFDVAAMALVLFFVPQPKRGIAEMMRVVRPGGTIGAYVWDLPGGGFPLDALWVAMRAAGMPVPQPPSAAISDMAVLKQSFVDSGLDAIETKVIDAERTFAGFEEFWDIALLSPSVGAAIKALPAKDHEALKADVRGRLKAGNGTLTATATANAIKARVRA